MSDSDIRLVHVATAPNETISVMWRDVLNDEGIMSMVKSGDTGYALGHNLLNEQYILVREDQAEAARGILDDFREGEGEIHWESS